MAALTIRNVDEALKQSLRLRAAQHGVSMEEARRILREALLRMPSSQPLGRRLRQRFAGVAQADFALPARRLPRTPPDWDAAP
ncbi:hypothetical protein Talka_01583 [Tepidimonas alkaliphilus]|uniref:Antitoxin FitA-like ribbon-helix-helix domain-containing protein n=1 Tax=Tepidimonas alkaliphilus TaxID=2588942 RepID=A0A554W7E6_9BURK|nr:plasmid stabilization protein [Tepidimonas alkaliphilus]TSE19494.1 hypothetical protein Talka_01583 [Tepidimonas alkaliphilus]